MKVRKVSPGQPADNRCCGKEGGPGGTQAGDVHEGWADRHR